MSRLKLSLLGPPTIEIENHLVSIQRRKTLALLIYLAVSGNHQRRDTLATLLWPNSRQKQARASLSRELSLLNTTLGQDWLDTDRETVCINNQRDLWLDTQQFQRGLEMFQSLSQPDQITPDSIKLLTEASALYRDDFLVGFSLSDCPAFDEWQSFQTESFRQDLVIVLQSLVSTLSSQEGYTAAISYARRWSALDPLSEPAHRALMHCYALTGHQALALRQYERCIQLLKINLDIPPTEETISLYERIRQGELRRQGDTSLLVENMPTLLPSVTPTEPPCNLPPQLTPFIGRQRELAELEHRLSEPTCRLLTLVGPGGVGKTRLAIQTAQNIASSASGKTSFSHGVHFVSLISVSSSDFLISKIADALDFTFYSSVDPKQQLLNYLREKRLLLILDNFEHLVESRQLMTDILVMSPGLKCLVTSRELLNLQEEWLYPVDGLQVPQDKILEEATPEMYDALALFAQTAQRVQPAFSISADKASVVRICRLVEGMPLGIELAAIWLKAFSCEKIGQAIERNHDFLATTMQNIPARHRSIQAVFEHSWQLLSEDERAFLKRLSVFRDGFYQEAAFEVTGAILPMLIALADKSLLRVSSGGRYYLHELLQQFVAEKLAEIQLEQVQSLKSHSNYYLYFLQQQEAKLTGPEQHLALEEVAVEVENIRTAWNWSVEQGRADNLNKALESLYYFFYTRSWFQEGKETFEKAAQRLQSIPFKKTNDQEPSYELVLARLWARQGAFCEALGFYGQASDLLQKSLLINRRLHQEQEIVFVLNTLGDVVERQGEYTAAKQLFQESLTISKHLKYSIGTVHSLERLSANNHMLGDYQQAKNLAVQSLATSRNLGQQRWLANMLDRLGTISFILGEYIEAEQYYQESLEFFNEIGDRFGTAMALGGLGWVAWALGEEKLPIAKSYYEQSLAICYEIGHLWQASGRLSVLGRIANDLGTYQLAEHYIEEGLKMATEMGYNLGIINGLNPLGETAIMQADLQSARRYLAQSLQIITETKLFPRALEAFIYIAILLVKEAEVDMAHNPGQVTLPQQEEKVCQAFELLALVQHHPASWQVFKDKATRLLVDLASLLPSETATAAQQRGTMRDLEATVDELLVALG